MSGGKKGQVRRAGRRAPAHNAAQLPLPLGLEPEPVPPEPEPVPPVPALIRRRKGQGFVPVTRDPDVARSYSDNVALDNAVAEGLARALATLPPEELAALRARVARARQGGRPAPREADRGPADAPGPAKSEG